MRMLAGAGYKWDRSLLLLYLAVGMGALFFALWLHRASADGPRFLLAPVSSLSSLFTGVPLAFREGTGYLGFAWGGTPFVVEKSCSGGNFLLLLFLLLAGTQPRRFAVAGWRLAAAVGCLVFSYLCAVAASSLRIAASVLLLDVHVGLDPVLQHNLIGIVTYLAFLCISYLAGGGIVSAVLKRTVCEDE